MNVYWISVDEYKPIPFKSVILATIEASGGWCQGYMDNHDTFRSEFGDLLEKVTHFIELEAP